MHITTVIPRYAIIILFCNNHYLSQVSEILSSPFVAKMSFDHNIQCNNFTNNSPELSVCLFRLLEFNSNANEQNSHGFLSPVPQISPPKNSTTQHPPPAFFLFLSLSYSLTFILCQGRNLAHSNLALNW